MKSLTKAVVFGTVAMALSACQPPLKIETEPTKAGYKAGFSTDRVAGSSNITIRAFTGANKDRKEVKNAKCQVSSEELGATLFTPGVLIVPTFVQNGKLANRGRPSHMRIECKANGETGVISFPATNKNVSTATNAGIAGAILTTVVTAALAATTPWRYPPVVQVQMTK